jgi:UDP-2,4-diacetamido-2,4,6-trideoxy-beta-L-altropyranose hydrolase
MLYEGVADLTGLPVYIDDNNRLDYPGGVVVNGTVFLEEMDYSKRSNVTYMLGSGYVPLRKEFQESPEKEMKKDIESIMVTFGGEDTRNMTPKVLELLSVRYPDLHKKVIVGQGFKNIDQIEKFKDGNTELIYCPDAEGMKRIMLESDIAISAAGQTLYELAQIGVPVIVIAVADNQLDNVKGWNEAGFIDYAGWCEDKDTLHSIMDKLALLESSELRKARSAIGRKMVDGMGADRTVRYCLEKCFKENIALREAQIGDMNDIYHLSNESEVRRNSFNQEKIKFKDHEKWFADQLNDDQCLYLVAEIDGEFIGQVRFDIVGSEAVISISICKRYRRAGAGRIVSERALKYLKTIVPDIKTVKAYIKEGNIPSVKYFENANFTFDKYIKVKNQNNGCDCALCAVRRCEGGREVANRLVPQGGISALRAVRCRAV